MIYQRLPWLVVLCTVLLVKVKIDASPYLATVVRLPRLASLIPPHPPAPTGYAVFFYNLGDMPDGGAIAPVPPLYSQHAVYVASAMQNGHFLVLSNTGPGVEAFQYSAKKPVYWKPVHKFRRKAIRDNSITPPLMVGADGTVWIWFESKAKKSDVLEIFSPGLKHRLGVCVLPRNHIYSEMVVVGKRAVVFTAGIPVIQRSPRYQIRVVQENGHTEHITREVGEWPPRYLSAVGNLVTGIGTNGQLVEFRVGKDGGIEGPRVMRLLVRRENLRVGPYTALDKDTGVCVLPVPNSHDGRLRYEIARISLKNGAITRTAPLDYPAYGAFDFNSLFAWRGTIFVLGESGTIHAYTRELRPIGSRPPVAPWPTNFAVSSPR